MRDWDNVRVFLGVCRHGSLAAAGRALRIDETTVGRRIRTLERELGTRLFDRTAQGLIPTDAGRAARVSAEAAEEGMLGIHGSAAGVDARPSGFVRVTATETLSTQFLIPALSEFHARYPDIQVEFFSGYIALDVARGEADIAIRALPPVGEHLVARRLGAVVLGIYAAPGYLARRPVGTFEEGLAGHDLIAFSDLVLPRPPGDSFLGADTTGARLVFSTNSPLGQTVAAEAGLGLATLPLYVAADRPGLIRVWPEHSQRYDLLAVMRREVTRTARVRAVVDSIVRYFKEQQARLEGGRHDLAAVTL